MRILFAAFVLILFTPQSWSLDPLSIIVAAGSAAAYRVEKLVCMAGMTECCDDRWITSDVKGLERNLKRKLHGQHLVIPIILNAVKGHVMDDSPKKPLVLSFHGWTGGGKSYVAQMIVDNLYKKGEQSNFVHTFYSEFHFKHPEKVAEYKEQLHSWIFHNVSKCGRSVFIFDQMDRMPEGMIDVLIPLLGHHSHVDGVDFRKSIFIFMSNVGGDLITETALRHKEGERLREDLSIQDMQKPLEMSAFNLMNGLKGSEIIKKQLIDYFVPFLPLERGHVRECVVDELKRRNISNYTGLNVEKVLDQLEWWPNDKKLYSKCGCTRVTHKTTVVML